MAKWARTLDDEADGQLVMPGAYTIMGEATLRGKDGVMYRADIDLAGQPPT